MKNNSTYSTESSDEKYNTSEYIHLILIPAYVLVIIIGLGGNSLVITVVKKKRSMHTTTNYLLVNLAVADLLNLIWCIPGQVLSLMEHPNGRLGDFLCKFVTRHHVAGITQLVSGLTLTVLAAERYKALFHPLQVRLRLTRKNVRYPIAVMWVFSVSYVIPLFLFEEFNEAKKFCEIVWEDSTRRLIYWTILAIITIVSSLIILFCYFNIIKGLYFTNTICSRGSAGSSTGSSTGSAQSETALNGKDEDRLEKRKIVKLLLTVTVVFFVCFIPFVVVSVIFTDVRVSVVYELCYFLVYCSSSLNPLVYAFHSSNFHEAFGEILSKFSDRLECTAIKLVRNRSKMSDLELRATYHPSQSDSNAHQLPKLIAFKKIEI